MLTVNTVERMTVEAFQEWCALPSNQGKRFELIAGEVIEMPAPRNYHNLIVSQIVHLLMSHMDTHRIGYVFGDNTDYILDEQTVIRPDASFVSFERAPTLPDYFTTAPDLAIEVVSPSNTERLIRLKTELYLAHGARLVWVIYDDEAKVYVYRPMGEGAAEMHILTATDHLDGGDVLPDFRIPVAALFPSVPSP